MVIGKSVIIIIINNVFIANSINDVSVSNSNESKNFTMFYNSLTKLIWISQMVSPMEY